MAMLARKLRVKRLFVAHPGSTTDSISQLRHDIQFFKPLYTSVAASALGGCSQIVEAGDARTAATPGTICPESHPWSMSAGQSVPVTDSGRARVMGKIFAVSRRQHLHHFRNPSHNSGESLYIYIK